MPPSPLSPHQKKKKKSGLPICDSSRDSDAYPAVAAELWVERFLLKPQQLTVQVGHKWQCQRSYATSAIISSRMGIKKTHTLTHTHTHTHVRGPRVRALPACSCRSNRPIPMSLDLRSAQARHTMGSQEDCLGAGWGLGVGSRWKDFRGMTCFGPDNAVFKA